MNREDMEELRRPTTALERAQLLHAAIARSPHDETHLTALNPAGIMLLRRVLFELEASVPRAVAEKMAEALRAFCNVDDDTFEGAALAAYEETKR